MHPFEPGHEIDIRRRTNRRTERWKHCLIPSYGREKSPKIACNNFYQLMLPEAKRQFRRHRNRFGRPGGCRTSNLTNRSFYVHIREREMNKNTSRKCISLYCDQLSLTNLGKYDANRCQILRLKCTKFDFRWGSATDPARGA